MKFCPPTRQDGMWKARTRDEPDVPDLDCPIFTPTDKPLGFCMPCETRHVRSMSRQCHELSKRSCQSCSKRQRDEGTHGSYVRSSRSSSTRGYIVQLDCAIPSCCEVSLVGRDGESIHLLRTDYEHQLHSFPKLTIRHLDRILPILILPVLHFTPELTSPTSKIQHLEATVSTHMLLMIQRATTHSTPSLPEPNRVVIPTRDYARRIS